MSAGDVKHDYHLVNPSPWPLVGSIAACVMAVGGVIAMKGLFGLPKGDLTVLLAGFAGATADAFTLIERLEAKLEQYPDQLARACVDLAKDWRTDRYLRRLEAMLLVADKSSIFTVTGVGDVLEPEYGVAAVGSGGNYALSAARALIEETELDAEQIARKAMKKDTGARGLRSIMEDVMLDIMFDLPENQGATYVINEQNVAGTEPVIPIRETRTKSA